MLSKGHQEFTIEFVESDAMIVLVHDDEAVPDGIHSNSGWAFEAIWLISILTESEPEVEESLVVGVAANLSSVTVGQVNL